MVVPMYTYDVLQSQFRQDIHDIYIVLHGVFQIWLNTTYMTEEIALL